MNKTIKGELETIQDNIQNEKYNLTHLEADEKIREKTAMISDKLHDIYWDLDEIINQE